MTAIVLENLYLKNIIIKWALLKKIAIKAEKNCIICY